MSESQVYLWLMLDNVSSAAQVVGWCVGLFAMIGSVILGAFGLFAPEEIAYKGLKEKVTAILQAVRERLPKEVEFDDGGGWESHNARGYNQAILDIREVLK